MLFFSLYQHDRDINDIRDPTDNTLDVGSVASAVLFRIQAITTRTCMATGQEHIDADCSDGAEMLGLQTLKQTRWSALALVPSSLLHFLEGSSWQWKFPGQENS